MHSCSIVIIVDDEKLFSKAIQGVMSEAGCEAHAFHIPGEALEFITTHHCDLMITDLKMPDMDGISLIAKARSACPLIRTILISAYLNQTDREDAAYHGVDLVMEKPVDLDLLISRTVELLSAPQTHEL